MLSAATDPLREVWGVRESLKPVALSLISMNGSALQEVQGILVSSPSVLPRGKGLRGKGKKWQRGWITNKANKSFFFFYDFQTLILGKSLKFFIILKDRPIEVLTNSKFLPTPSYLEPQWEIFPLLIMQNHVLYWQVLKQHFLNSGSNSLKLPANYICESNNIYCDWNKHKLMGERTSFRCFLAALR